MAWFPWCSGTLRLPAANPQHAAEETRDVLIQELRSRKARSVRVAGNTLSFTGGFFRLVINWNPLVAIGRGRIDVQAGEDEVIARYRISFLQLTLVTTALIAVLYALSVSQGISFPVGVYVFMWLGSIGGNALVAAVRFRDFVRRCMETACGETQGKPRLKVSFVTIGTLVLAGGGIALSFPLVGVLPAAIGVLMVITGLVLLAWRAGQA